MAKKESYKQYKQVKVEFINENGKKKYRTIKEPGIDPATGAKLLNGKHFSYAESNTLYADHLVWNVVDNQLVSQSATRPIYIDIPRVYSVYNFEDKKHKHTTSVIMNLVAMGHAVVLVDKDNAKQFRLGRPSRGFIDTQLLAQIKYAYVEMGWSSIKDPILLKYMQDNFGTRDRAIRFLTSAKFAKQEQKHNRYFTLKDMLREALMLRHEERLLDMQYELQTLRLSHLDRARHLLGGLEWDQVEQIPNQATSPALTDKIQVSLSFLAELKGTVKEWGTAYVQSHKDLVHSEIDRKEQQIVNAYYHNHDEFRVLTRDEKVARFNELHQMIEDIKSLSDPRAKAKAVSRFARTHLEEYDLLEHEVGQYETPNGHIDELEEYSLVEYGIADLATPHGNIEDLAVTQFPTIKEEI